MNDEQPRASHGSANNLDFAPLPLQTLLSYLTRHLLSTRACMKERNKAGKEGQKAIIEGHTLAVLSLLSRRSSSTLARLEGREERKEIKQGRMEIVMTLISFLAKHF